MASTKAVSARQQWQTSSEVKNQTSAIANGGSGDRGGGHRRGGSTRDGTGGCDGPATDDKGNGDGHVAPPSTGATLPVDASRWTSGGGSSGGKDGGSGRYGGASRVPHRWQLPCWWLFHVHLHARVARSRVPRRPRPIDGGSTRRRRRVGRSPSGAFGQSRRMEWRWRRTHGTVPHICHARRCGGGATRSRSDRRKEGLGGRRTHAALLNAVVKVTLPPSMSTACGGTRLIVGSGGKHGPGGTDGSVHWRRRTNRRHRRREVVWSRRRRRRRLRSRHVPATAAATTAATTSAAATGSTGGRGVPTGPSIRSAAIIHRGGVLLGAALRAALRCAHAVFPASRAVAATVAAAATAAAAIAAAAAAAAASSTAADCSRLHRPPGAVVVAALP